MNASRNHRFRIGRSSKSWDVDVKAGKKKCSREVRSTDNDIITSLATKERQNSRNDSDLDNEETDGERNRKKKNEVK
jgi:hypothetical protein